jgi:hypothetical protein
MELESERLAKTVIRMVVIYASWILSSAIVFFFVLRLRVTYLMIMTVIAESHDRVRSTAAFADKVGFIALGCLAIIIIGIVESYLIQGGKLGMLPRRIARVFGIQLLAFTAMDLLNRSFIGMGNWHGPAKRIFCGETVIGLALVAFSLMPPYRRTKMLLDRLTRPRVSKADSSQTRTGID